ncbi:MAG: DUF4166 domain-containing protein [Thalassospira sp.]|jgi:predicted DCC family thiol-disulfide oxidoreductase YuxK|nr:DUF4166 domain-containing protein [Thalassospira sp.]
MKAELKPGDVWYVYDGECPLCRFAAQGLRIKQTVGQLHLIDARTAKDHPVLAEITLRRLDLDAGTVLKFQERFYHGADALHMMALLGSEHNWFNRLNALLFRSRTLAAIFYPMLRAARNALLVIRGAPKIHNVRLPNDKPIFQSVLGQSWETLPPLMQQHYAVRPYSQDRVTVEGTMDVHQSRLVGLLARLTGMLIPYAGRNIPIRVVFHSSEDSEAFHFQRTLSFPGKAPITFNSHMESIGGSEMVEFMRFGVGWKLAYEWTGEKMILHHRGYVWRVFGWMLPVPLSLIMGKGYAEEIPVSETDFHMWTHTLHPLFGKMFGYGGTFKITEIACSNAS